MAVESARHYTGTTKARALIVWLFSSQDPLRKIPGPTPLPFFGNALMLNPSLHMQLYEMAKTYGPIMRISIFNQSIIILNSADMCLEAFIRKGNIFILPTQVMLLKKNHKGLVKHPAVNQFNASCLSFQHPLIFKTRTVCMLEAWALMSHSFHPPAITTSLCNIYCWLWPLIISADFLKYTVYLSAGAQLTLMGICGAGVL